MNDLVWKMTCRQSVVLSVCAAVVTACGTPEPPPRTAPPAPPERAVDAPSSPARAPAPPPDPAAALSAASSSLRSAVKPAPPPWRCTQQQWLKLRETDPDDPAVRSVRWRTSAADWRSPVLRQRVGKGLAHYRTIVPLYQRRGICDVGRFLREGIVTTTFLGRSVWIHAGIVDALRTAERLLVERDAAPRQMRVGTFAARTIRGPYGSLPWLSNHALGLALDVDAHENPYLTHKDIEALELVSGTSIELRTSVPAGDRWDTFDKAQRIYARSVNEWLADNRRQLGELQRKKAAGQDVARELAELERQRELIGKSRHLPRSNRARGSIVMSLSRDFVVSMEEAGFTWATDFSTGADLMHFEHRGWRHRMRTNVLED